MLGEQKKLGSLLKDFKFQIPDYQRAYEWKVDNFDDFIEDLNYYKKHKTTAIFSKFLAEYHDHFESWDTEAIKNRAKALSKISYKKLWKIINKVH